MSFVLRILDLVNFRHSVCVLVSWCCGLLAVKCDGTCPMTEVTACRSAAITC